MLEGMMKQFIEETVKEAVKEALREELPKLLSDYRLTPDEAYFTVNQVAERVGVSTRTVRRWISDGKLSYQKIGRNIRIKKSDLDSMSDNINENDPRKMAEEMLKRF